MNKLKYLSFLFAALVSVGCMFTSCDDDDNFPIENQIAGEYKGTLDVSMAEQSMATDMPQNITVDKAASNAINLTLANFSIAGMSVGDVTLTGLVLNEQNSGTYSFSGTQSLTLADPVGTVPVEYFGVITNGKITIDLGITWNDMDIAVAYQGDKLNGTESGEAAITAFSFKADEDDDLSFITSQPVINADNTITFSVADTATTEHLQTLQPVVEVSAGATYTASGSDYMTGVTYTVVSENGHNIATYTVSIAARINSLKYSFDEWETSGAYDYPAPRTELASSLEGASFIAGTYGVPVLKSTDDKFAGDAAAKLVTLNTSMGTTSLIPALTSGSLFTGSFDLFAAIFDKLNSTKFGIVYDKKPLRFKGYYKYTPGEIFINGEDENGKPVTTPAAVDTIENRIDECSIQAVLYEAATSDFTLTGHDINTSETRVAVAALSDGSAKAEWTAFDLAFEWLDGKTYDPSKTYKLAIVCSSSKEGDHFRGAGGSTLMLDELEVTGEVVATETAE